MSIYVPGSPQRMALGAGLHTPGAGLYVPGAGLYAPGSGLYAPGAGLFDDIGKAANKAGRDLQKAATNKHTKRAVRQTREFVAPHLRNAIPMAVDESLSMLGNVPTYGKPAEMLLRTQEDRLNQWGTSGFDHGNQFLANKGYGMRNRGPQHQAVAKPQTRYNPRRAVGKGLLPL